MKFFIVSLALLFCTACSHSLEPAPANDEIVLINKTNETIYYAAFEQGILARIQWTSLSRDANRLRAGEAKPVQFSEIYAFDPGKNFVLFWWKNDQNQVAHLSSLVITPQKLKSTGRRLVLSGFTQ